MKQDNRKEELQKFVEKLLNDLKKNDKMMKEK